MTYLGAPEPSVVTAQRQTSSGVQSGVDGYQAAWSMSFCRGSTLAWKRPEVTIRLEIGADVFSLVHTVL